jgi:hypothetical protein
MHISPVLRIRTPFAQATHHSLLPDSHEPLPSIAESDFSPHRAKHLVSCNSLPHSHTESVHRGSLMRTSMGCSPASPVRVQATSGAAFSDDTASSDGARLLQHSLASQVPDRQDPRCPDHCRAAGLGNAVLRLTCAHCSAEGHLGMRPSRSLPTFMGSALTTPRDLIEVSARLRSMHEGPSALKHEHLQALDHTHGHGHHQRHHNSNRCRAVMSPSASLASTCKIALLASATPFAYASPGGLRWRMYCRSGEWSSLHSAFEGSSSRGLSSADSDSFARHAHGCDEVGKCSEVIDTRVMLVDSFKVQSLFPQGCSQVQCSYEAAF